MKGGPDEMQFARFDPADWTVPGNNQRESNAVFQRSPIIILAGFMIYGDTLLIFKNFQHTTIGN